MHKYFFIVFVFIFFVISPEVLKAVENFTEAFDNPSALGFTTEIGTPIFSAPPNTITFIHEGQLYRQFGPGSFVAYIDIPSLTFENGTSNSFFYRIYDGMDNNNLLLFQAKKVTLGVLVLYGKKVNGITSYQTTETIESLNTLKLQVVWYESSKTYFISAAYNNDEIQLKAEITMGASSPTADRFERIFLGGLNASYPLQPTVTIDYCRMTPLEATNPSPENLQSDVNSNPELKWESGGIAKIHNVFFGTDETSVANAEPLYGDLSGNGLIDLRDFSYFADNWLYSQNLSMPLADLNFDNNVNILDLKIFASNWLNSGNGIFKGSYPVGNEFYSPGVLNPDTTYYWRVDEVDNFGETTIGDVWNFRTTSAKAANPRPANGLERADTSSVLIWKPVPFAASYNIYFGTNLPLDGTMFKVNDVNSFYIPGNLAVNQNYYWRVDTVTSDNNVVMGDIWHFKTVNTIPGTNSLINLLPNRPADYVLRDWKDVAIKYNSLVCDFNSTGQYLPLVWWDTKKQNFDINCPYIPSFVGIAKGGDGLNMFGTVVGSTLSGINMANYKGHNWVNSMMQFYGVSIGRQIVGNNKTDQCSSSLWYDVVPGIYFFQLVDLYPETALIQVPYSFQPGSKNMVEVMQSTANKWYEVLDFLGGSATGIADFNGVVGFNTVTMQIDDRDGTHEGMLESAGGLAWVQYMAYRKFGDKKYLNGTEWALNYLQTIQRNPTQNDVQIGYGILVAARMNAELGYNYDVDQIFRWAFGEGEPLRRGWGVLYGKWGGYEVSGLIGTEDSRGGEDRAYAKQGFHMVSSLVPLVRYDTRYASAVGKWVLHLASSSRNYYQTFLAEENSDSPFWYGDPDGVIPFESLRGYHPVSYFQDYLNKLNASPDSNPAVKTKVNAAIQNPPDNWGSGYSGALNGGIGLCLYFGGDVGILGGIIRPTNVSKILQLNLLTTDFFRDAAYPSYLYYNPYSSSKSVEINTGNNPVDIYDSTTHDFIATNVSGIYTFNFPANSAKVLVLAPAGGQITYSGWKKLINGVIVDYKF